MPMIFVNSALKKRKPKNMKKRRNQPRRKSTRKAPSRLNRTRDTPAGVGMRQPGGILATINNSVMRLRYSEMAFIAVVPASSANPLSCSFWPGITGCTRLDTFASLYNQWRLKSLRCRYVPSCGSDTSGQQVLVFDMDNADVPPNYAATQQILPRALSTVRDNAAIQVPVQFAMKSKWHVTQPASVPTDGAYGPAGRVCWHATGTNDVTVGSIWFDYDIEFSGPTAFPALTLKGAVGTVRDQFEFQGPEITGTVGAVPLASGPTPVNTVGSSSLRGGSGTNILTMQVQNAKTGAGAVGPSVRMNLTSGEATLSGLNVNDIVEVLLNVQGAVLDTSNATMSIAPSFTTPGLGPNASTVRWSSGYAADSGDAAAPIVQNWQIAITDTVGNLSSAGYLLMQFGVGQLFSTVVRMTAAMSLRKIAQLTGVTSSYTEFRTHTGERRWLVHPPEHGDKVLPTLEEALAQLDLKRGKLPAARPMVFAESEPTSDDSDSDNESVVVLKPTPSKRK